MNKDKKERWEFPWSVRFTPEKLEECVKDMTEQHSCDLINDALKMLDNDKIKESKNENPK